MALGSAVLTFWALEFRQAMASMPASLAWMLEILTVIFMLVCFFPAPGNYLLSPSFCKARRNIFQMSKILITILVPIESIVTIISNKQDCIGKLLKNGSTVFHAGIQVHCTFFLCVCVLLFKILVLLSTNTITYHWFYLISDKHG